MVRFQDYEESVDKLQDDITTLKHLETCTMPVYTTVHPGYLML